MDITTELYSWMHELGIPEHVETTAGVPSNVDTTARDTFTHGPNSWGYLHTWTEWLKISLQYTWAKLLGYLQNRDTTAVDILQINTTDGIPPPIYTTAQNTSNTGTQQVVISYLHQFTQQLWIPPHVDTTAGIPPHVH
jgi:hypothetical protein